MRFCCTLTCTGPPNVTDQVKKTGNRRILTIFTGITTPFMHIRQHIFSPGEVKIRPETICRLMNLAEDDIHEPYRSMIDNEISNAGTLTDVLGGYRIIEPALLQTNKYVLEAGGQSFHIGKQVTQYLAGIEKAVFFICTAGPAISERIHTFFQSGDHLAGYVADITGSVLVEEAMDIIHHEIAEIFTTQNLKFTNRYSPGYCDWKVDEQQQLFQLFPPDFCGIRLSDSMLMTPVKSVSGVIGIGKKVTYNPYACHACNSVNCIYRHKKKP